MLYKTVVCYNHALVSNCLFGFVGPNCVQETNFCQNSLHRNRSENVMFQSGLLPLGLRGKNNDQLGF